MAQQFRDQADAEALLHHVVAQITREEVTSAQCHSVRRAARRRAKVRASRIKLGIVLPIFFTLTTLNVATEGVPDSLRERGQEDDHLAQRSALSFAVYELESYRDDTGTLPLHLDGLDIPEFGKWRYQRLDDTSYTIELTDAGITIGFDSRFGDTRIFADEGGTR